MIETIIVVTACFIVYTIFKTLLEVFKYDYFKNADIRTYQDMRNIDDGMKNIGAS